MTKYVLNSGGIKKHPEKKKKFHLEIIKALSDSPKVLVCIFAQPREYWEQKFSGVCESFTSDMPKGISPSFELAMPATFEQQVEKSDIVYCLGGDSALLNYWLGDKDLKRILEGKVFAGNSATSDMIASSFWTCDWRACEDGFGILPIKFIPHFNSDWGSDDERGPIDWEKAKQELAEYGDKSLPIYALEEGEFEVFEV